MLLIRRVIIYFCTLSLQDFWTHKEYVPGCIVKQILMRPNSWFSQESVLSSWKNLLSIDVYCLKIDWANLFKWYITYCILWFFAKYQVTFPLLRLLGQRGKKHKYIEYFYKNRTTPANIEEETTKRLLKNIFVYDMANTWKQKTNLSLLHRRIISPVIEQVLLLMTSATVAELLPQCSCSA